MPACSPTSARDMSTRQATFGAATVFFSRMVPIICTFISLPAGAARMPF